MSILAGRAVTVSGHEIVTCVVGEMVMVGKWVTMDTAVGHACAVLIRHDK